MLQRHPEIDNPYALAWSMHRKGNRPHYKPMPDDSTLGPGRPKKKDKYKESCLAGFREYIERFDVG